MSAEGLTKATLRGICQDAPIRRKLDDDKKRRPRFEIEVNCPHFYDCRLLAKVKTAKIREDGIEKTVPVRFAEPSPYPSENLSKFDKIKRKRAYSRFKKKSPNYVGRRKKCEALAGVARRSKTATVGGEKLIVPS